MVQETMNGTGNLDGPGDHGTANLDGSRDHEWYRKSWMVQETLDGLGGMNGTGNHELYRKPGWFRKP